MNQLTVLIKEDMKPALGVTEPGAIAFAVATAKKYADEEVCRVSVALNSGMYKNAYTCGIPNSEHYGNLYAAALGAIAAKPELGLESLSEVGAEDNEKAEEMVRTGMVKAYMSQVSSQISIDATVETKHHVCTASIRDSHTNITEIKLDGEAVYCRKTDDVSSEDDADNKPQNGDNTANSLNSRGATGDKENSKNAPVIHQHTFHDILEYVNTVPIEEIAFIEDAFHMNMELLQEGLASDRAVIAKQLLAKNGGDIFSDDEQKTAQLLCNGAIEARVLGLNRPAMSITGSGAHGIIATMPLYAYKRVRANISDEQLLRATALSFLETMYIKEYSGKLSAFCGCGIAAGTGMACGLALLKGADEAQEEKVIRNMASGLTGMICDGGNHGCAMKGIVAVDAAFQSVDLAMAGIAIESIHGINGATPEDTMRYMGMIASPGMTGTEKTIVDIMEHKSV